MQDWDLNASSILAFIWIKADHNISSTKSGVLGLGAGIRRATESGEILGGRSNRGEYQGSGEDEVQGGRRIMGDGTVSGESPIRPEYKY